MKIFIRDPTDKVFEVSYITEDSENIDLRIRQMSGFINAIKLDKSTLYIFNDSKCKEDVVKYFRKYDINEQGYSRLVNITTKVR